MRTLLCLILATALWLPSLHLWFHATPAELRQPLANRQLEVWNTPQPEGLAALRRTNPEWDLMSRTFAVLAFANLALEEGNERYLPTIDRIIDETIALEAAHGHRHFLLPYVERAPFVDPDQRSLFVDGEIALMLGARQLVAADPGAAARLRARVDLIAGQLERGPVLLGESYPDEAWVFCNAVAIAAVRLADLTTRSDHRDLIARWLRSARAHLIDPQTGLLVSKTTLAGEHIEGPEGSTIWLVADMLLVVDPELARAQYERARAELASGVFGFGWAREWPSAWPGAEDVDSGPTIPIVGANAGASGLALVGAAAFDDRAYLASLLASLELGAFPIEGDDGLRFAAGNQLADAVILYALSTGPLWRRAAALGGGAS